MERHLFKHVENNYRLNFGEELHIESQRSLGGGCINSAFKLETNRGELFLKMNAHGPEDLFIREAESLNEFHKSRNEFIVFPKPLLAKAIDHLPGYLLTTFLAGGNTENDDEKLGRGLAQLHQFTNDKYGFHHNNYCGATLQDNNFNSNWIQFYKMNRIGHLISLIKQSRSWSTSDQHLTDLFLSKVDTYLDYKTKPSLIHGDLWSGNYMYTYDGPALIDPCACYCDREFEMGIMTMFGGFSSRVYDAYNEYWPLDSGWEERNLIYQLYHILNHYYLFGGGYKMQALEIMKQFS